MPNARLSSEKQVFILAALSEGMAMNAVCRTFRVGKVAVSRVIEETGEALGAYMAENFRGLPCKRLAIDEQWQYVGIHGQRMERKEKERGDFWLWCALDPDTKLVVSHHIGSRGRIDCEDFVHDLARRVTGAPQITTDQFRNYAFAIRSAFGGRCSYATETKDFVDKWQEGQPSKRRNGIPKIAQAERKAISGSPDLAAATTAHVERLFLTVRQELKRYARLGLGYSKDLLMHRRATAMHLGIYNLVRRHSSLDGSTPAMAAGVEYRRWSLEDVVALTARHMKAKEDAAFERAFLAAGL